MTYLNSIETSPHIYYEFKIILIGDSTVGKTSLLSCYMNEQFLDKRMSNINVDFRTKSITIDQFTSAKLKIWDTCGQERFRSLTCRYFKDAQGIILVYDVTKRETFNNLDKWIKDIEDYVEKEELSIILVGNKIDLEFRDVTTGEGEIYAEYNNLMFCETSSKTGKNVTKVFDMISKDIIHKENLDTSKITSPPPSLKAVKGKMIKKKKEINCC